MKRSDAEPGGARTGGAVRAARSLALVAAHPDDDLALTGTIALHAEDTDLRFVMALAASGESGPIADPTLVPREELGVVREKEVVAAWRTLGRSPDRLEFWRYPDGHVDDVPLAALTDRVAAFLGEERPDVVVTFGPDGITANPDHIAIGRATEEAFHRVRGQGDRGLRRLLFMVLAQSAIDRFNVHLAGTGQDLIDPTRVLDPRGVPDGTIGVIVDCSAVWRRSLSALRAHETQARDLQYPWDSEDMLSQETYVQAWPERVTGADIARDVFEGV
jgi:LmbE family N-acetylglucosaminyl deacetylase